MVRFRHVVEPFALVRIGGSGSACRILEAGAYKRCHPLAVVPPRTVHDDGLKRAEPFRLEQLHQCHIPVGVPRHGQQQIVRQRYIANDSLHSVRSSCSCSFHTGLATGGSRSMRFECTASVRELAIASASSSVGKEDSSIVSASYGSSLSSSGFLH
uniref:Uncharacterized protein n=1 Tax=Anopheles melas TaxID=34690 RepID=A0A182TZ73_9DIPT